jgi:ATP-binding cassette, subfamily B, bacterial PglK
MFKLLFNLLKKSFLLNFFFIIIIKIFSSVLDVIGLLLILFYTKFIFDNNYIQNNVLFKKILADQFQSYNLFIIFSWFVVFFFIIKFLINLLIDLARFKFIEKFIYHFSVDLFKQYIFRNYSYFLKINISELTRNFTIGLKNLKDYISAVFDFFQNFFLIIGVISLIIFLEKNNNVLFVLLFFFILSFLFYTITKKKISNIGLSILKYDFLKIKFITQVFNSINQIKILSLENFFIKMHKSYSAKYHKNFRKRDFIFYLPKNFFELAMVIFIVIICLSLMYNSNTSVESNISTLTILILSSIRLYPSFNGLVSSVMQMKNNHESIKYFYNQVNYKNEFVNFKPNKYRKEKKINLNRPFLQFKKVSFVYPDSNNIVLKDLNITIEKGKIIGVVGKSGVGKTTFVNLILGLLTPTKGNIYVHGINIANQTQMWRSQIGYIPQDVFLLDDNIKNNIAFGINDSDINESLIKKILLLVKLNTFSQKINLRPEYQIGERGRKISGGQKQRIAIARALYRNPNFLIFDEATNSLDEKTEKNILNMIYRIRDNKTIIFITHKPSLLKYCDYILEFKEKNSYQYRKNYLK